AAHISSLLADYPLPLFVQWEIGDVLRGWNTAVSHRAIPQNEYLSTRGVLAQFKDAWQEKYGAVDETAVILIAHPDHQPRCRELLLEAGFQPLIPAASIPWEQFGCDKFGYDPDSVQPWTRNRAAFLAYELSIRMKRDAEIHGENKETQ
ncbi:MAG: hypothetical protein GY805_17540, partial [Chloroflexi bacterium]|nr:hypothetical protein [Chloroflexota bacterium]